MARLGLADRYKPVGPAAVSWYGVGAMKNPNAVFVICGVIGVIFGLSVSVLSLPLLLRYVAPEEAETPTKMQKLPSRVSEDLNTDGSDIIKELETDFPSRKAIRAQLAYTPRTGEKLAAPDSRMRKRRPPSDPRSSSRPRHGTNPCRRSIPGKSAKRRSLTLTPRSRLRRLPPMSLSLHVRWREIRRRSM